MTRLRGWLWTLGRPLRWLLTGSIDLYRVTLSGWFGGSCRFYPSCSQYAKDAIRAKGALRGSALACWRILRCNPFGAGGVDHAPRVRPYDAVLHTASRRAEHRPRSA